MYLKIKNWTDTMMALSSNQKFTNPYKPNSDIVKLYPTYNTNLNSYMFNNTSVFPTDKTYNTFQYGYKHYIDQVYSKQEQLIKAQEALIKKTLQINGKQQKTASNSA